MIDAFVLALLTAITPADVSSGRVFLKKAAATAAACRTSPLSGDLVQAPLFSPASEQCPVAVVGDESIVLRELAETLEVGHLSRSPRKAAPVKQPEMDFAPALDRLITTRLLIQEAREMRLDEAPEVTAAFDSFKESRRRAMLQRIAVRGAKPDEAEVARLYRNAVREWKIKSLLFEQEDAAKGFEAALKAGGGFDALASKFVAEKKAKGGGKAEYAAPNDMLPEVRAAVETAKRGVPTGIVKVPSGWVILRVDGARYPENPEARAEARAASLARVEHEKIRAFYLSLVKKYATVDKPLLKQLDFEANGEEGFRKLLDDKRPVVTIRGEAPVTVGDLARDIGRRFFHGVKGPIQERKVNRYKTEAFERLLGARLFAKEAAVRNVDARPEFVREVEEYERGLLFNTFVEKVIAPDVKVTERDAAMYYEANKAQYTAPQMYKLDGIAFAGSAEAGKALDKLKGGTDFAFLRSASAGQLAPEQRSLEFEGRTLSASALPAALTKVLTGARSGDYRLYAASDKEVYVIRVIEEMPPTPKPYVEARETIAKHLFDEKLASALRDYADKLRKAQPVDVLITRVSL